jgi:hypothetical protein
MLGWRMVLGLAGVDAGSFFLSGSTSQGSRHSGTVSQVLWVDFLLGVLLPIAFAVAMVLRGVLTLVAR